MVLEARQGTVVEIGRIAIPALIGRSITNLILIIVEIIPVPSLTNKINLLGFRDAKGHRHVRHMLLS